MRRLANTISLTLPSFVMNKRMCYNNYQLGILQYIITQKLCLSIQALPLLAPFETYEKHEVPARLIFKKNEAHTRPSTHSQTCWRMRKHNIHIFSTPEWRVPYSPHDVKTEQQAVWVNIVSSVRPHSVKYSTFKFTTVGQTPLSWTKRSFQCHFLFFSSCASWPRLLPLLFYLQRNLLSISLTHRDDRSRDAASLVCVQKLFLRTLWTTEWSWMETFCLCRPPSQYQQQQKNRKMICQRQTAALLRNRRALNQLKNCGMYFMFYTLTGTRNRIMA